MVNLNKRIEKLEQTTQEIPDLSSIEWTPEEKQFRDDIHRRMREKEAKFYFEVCDEKELNRVRQLSTKACLISLKDSQKFNRQT